MSTGNKRINELAPGFYTEALADHISVSWNPIEEEAVINFASSIYLRSGEDEYLSKIRSDSNVSIMMSQLHNESFEIGEKTITGLDMDIFVRMLYDKLYNEQIKDTTEVPLEDIEGFPQGQ